MYLVLIPCRNDTTDQQWQPDDFLYDGEVSEAVIDNWIEIGVLAPAIVADEEE